jgi:hypothetical protein
MKKLLTAGFLLIGMAAAFAASTVNPNIPTPGSALSSAPIRANFAATYNDITALQARFPASAADGGFGSNISAQSGVPLFATGVPTFTGTTGTGNFARAASPTFSGTTVIGNGSVLNTPASLTLTNATGLPISGISGMGANVASWLATPSSANLAAAVTDETGTGSLVFNNVPVFIAPVLGAATGNSLALNTCVLGSNVFCATGTANISGATTIGGALTYGSVTLSNSVTGTGSMVLSASPTLTGTVTLPSRSGNTTTYVTTTGTQTSGRCVVIDASGNHVADTGSCGNAATTGSWTPTYVGSSSGSGASYLVQEGSYVHTALVGGKYLTHVEFYLRGSPGTISGTVNVGGLPFTIDNTGTGNSRGGCSISEMQTWTYPAGSFQVGLVPITNTTTLGMIASGSGIPATGMPVANMPANAVLRASCDYISSN